jgi:hypothetical protein
MKSGNLNFLESSGPLQAWNGTALLGGNSYYKPRCISPSITWIFLKSHTCHTLYLPCNWHKFFCNRLIRKCFLLVETLLLHTPRYLAFCYTELPEKPYCHSLYLPFIWYKFCCDRAIKKFILLVEIPYYKPRCISPSFTWILYYTCIVFCFLFAYRHDISVITRRRWTTKRRLYRKTEHTEKYCGSRGQRNIRTITDYEIDRVDIGVEYFRTDWQKEIYTWHAIKSLQEPWLILLLLLLP